MHLLLLTAALATGALAAPPATDVAPRSTRTRKPPMKAAPIACAVVMPASCAPREASVHQPGGARPHEGYEGRRAQAADAPDRAGGHHLATGTALTRTIEKR